MWQFLSGVQEMYVAHVFDKRKGRSPIQKHGHTDFSYVVKIENFQ